MIHDKIFVWLHGAKCRDRARGSATVGDQLFLSRGSTTCMQCSAPIRRGVRAAHCQIDRWRNGRILLRGTIVNRTYCTQKNYQVYIYLFLPTVFGPTRYLFAMVSTTDCICAAINCCVYFPCKHIQTCGREKGISCPPAVF